MIRLFLGSLWFLALWIVILRLGVWIAMVVFHIIITVDVIRGIPWSISGFGFTLPKGFSRGSRQFLGQRGK